MNQRRDGFLEYAHETRGKGIDPLGRISTALEMSLRTPKSICGIRTHYSFSRAPSSVVAEVYVRICSFQSR